MRLTMIWLFFAMAACGQLTLPNATPAPVAVQQFLDKSGKPLVGAKYCSYQAGTSTPLATYTDYTAGTPNTNPVILDTAGRAAIYFGAKLYKVVLRTGGGATDCNTGTVVYSADFISDTTLYFVNYVKTAGTATLISYTDPLANSVARTVSSRLADIVSAKDFGVLCDNSTDDTTALQTALTSAAATGASVLIPASANPCLITSLTVSDSQDIHGDGVGATVIKITGNNHTGFSLIGGHASIHDMTIIKASSTTGVKAIGVNVAGNAITSYNKFYRLKIQGNGSGDLITDGIFISSGTAAGCAGADCGAFYNSIEDVDIRYALNGVHGTSTDPNVGANATTGENVRVGDSTNGWRITRGDTNRVFAFAAEGCTKGIWIETGAGGANNNSNFFVAPRMESNTTDVQVDASDFYNSFYLHSTDPAKITDSGTGTLFLSPDGLMKLPGGIAYTSADALLNIVPVNGVRSLARLQSYWCWGSCLTTNQVGGILSYLNITAPNSNYGYPLAIQGDSVHRAIAFTSQGFSTSGNTGTLVSIADDGHITATSSGTSSFAPIIVPQLQINGGSIVTALGTMKYYLVGSTSWSPTILNLTMGSTDVTVTGCATTDFAFAAFPALAASTASVTARVRASSTVQIEVMNVSGGTITPSGTVYAGCIGN